MTVVKHGVCRCWCGGEKRGKVFQTSQFLIYLSKLNLIYKLKIFTSINIKGKEIRINPAKSLRSRSYFLCTMYLYRKTRFVRHPVDTMKLMHSNISVFVGYTSANTVVMVNAQHRYHVLCNYVYIYHLIYILCTSLTSHQHIDVTCSSAHSFTKR